MTRSHPTPWFKYRQDAGKFCHWFIQGYDSAVVKTIFACQNIQGSILALPPAHAIDPSSSRWMRGSQSLWPISLHDLLFAKFQNTRILQKILYRCKLVGHLFFYSCLFRHFGYKTDRKVMQKSFIKIRKKHIAKISATMWSSSPVENDMPKRVVSFEFELRSEIWGFCNFEIVSKRLNLVFPNFAYKQSSKIHIHKRNP